MSWTVRTQIEIDAPASVVWHLLIDLEHYHDWNPFIVRAQGRIAPGARIEVSPQLTGRRRTTFWPVVTSYVEGSEFAWTGTIGHPWFARGEHRFRLTPISAECVRVEHDEAFFGIGGTLVGLVAGKLTQRGFEAMNEALEHEAEARCRRKPGDMAK
jgi:hypothetical protein